jgi:hypothetical protein
MGIFEQHGQRSITQAQPIHAGVDGELTRFAAAVSTGLRCRAVETGLAGVGKLELRNVGAKYLFETCMMGADRNCCRFSSGSSYYAR